jgi:hypothetical protein
MTCSRVKLPDRARVALTWTDSADPTYGDRTSSIIGSC